MTDRRLLTAEQVVEMTIEERGVEFARRLIDALHPLIEREERLDRIEAQVRAKRRH